MRRITWMLGLGMILAACNDGGGTAKHTSVAKDSVTTASTLEVVFADSTYQLTGVAVAGSRLFVNYPYWLPEHGYSVVEVKQGRPVPYPDERWNSFHKDNGQHKFVCVQSVVADDNGYLWVVDAAGIGLGKVWEQSNKVVKINLATDSVERIYRFPAAVAGENAYINDIRVDNQHGYAYLTSSSTGGIVVLNTITGKSRFVLGNSSSVHSDTSYHFSPLGTELKMFDGKPLKVNSDGIALSPDGEWLYYKPLTDDRLYRIKTSLLRDSSNTDKQLESAVEYLGRFVTSDGMIFDKAGNLYLGDLEKSSLVKITPDLHMQVLVTDTSKLRWPDSYSIAEDGYLYITASQIQYMPWFHGNVSQFKRPFQVYRWKL